MHRPLARPPALLLLCLPLVLGCTVRRGGGDDDDGGGPGTPLAAGLSIDAISINQGVEILLMEGGSEVSSSDRNSPVIEGRGGIIRVYVERGGDFEPRDITAAVTFREGEDVIATHEVTENVTGDSSETSLGSTFNIDLDPDEITDSTSITVSLHESESGDFSGSTSGASWDEPIDLRARSTDGALRIAYIPIQYNADGSGRLPDTSDAQINRIRERFERLYPTSEVSIELEDAVAWNSVISPFGQGWDTILEALYGYRQSAGFDDDVYLFAAFNPAASFGDFCSSGCVAGLSFRVTSASNADQRVSIGVGYSGEDMTETMAHEIGHAHGREHAPCGLQGQPSDSGYPYSGATLGVVGYDVVDGGLVQPTSNFDIMSYCQPSWVSDYTWEAFYNRIVSVNGLGSRIVNGTPTWYQTAIVGANGTIRRGTSEVELMLPPEGERHVLELLDADGALIEAVEGILMPFDHLPGGVLLVPEVPTSVTSVRLDGAEATPW